MCKCLNFFFGSKNKGESKAMPKDMPKFNGVVEYVTTPQEIGRNIPSYHFGRLLHANGKVKGKRFASYYILHNSPQDMNNVGLAVSDDGVTFEFVGQVLGKTTWYDDLQASFPGVAIGPDGLLYMLYEARSSWQDMNSVCLAVSSDGLIWEKKGPIIVPNQNQYRTKTGRKSPGSFANVDVGAPSLFWDCGGWNVYFHGFDGRYVQMGYAFGTDLFNLDIKKDPIIMVETDPNRAGSGTRGWRTNFINGRDGYRYVCTENSTYNLRSGEKNRFEGCWWGGEIWRTKNYDGPFEVMRRNNLNTRFLPLDGMYPNEPDGLFPRMGWEPVAILQEGDIAWVYYRDETGGCSRIGIKVKGMTY